MSSSLWFSDGLHASGGRLKNGGAYSNAIGRPRLPERRFSDGLIKAVLKKRRAAQFGGLTL
ncbi:hypothetical protein HMPREF9123_1955 [Neisseria bacilliformis ATCC BAA-1200]|uniref:Uncharacterized protein n=1 Tax=Neisseria bacilliformis ATCC BAA-1200 TaxID=888742 RepID=F2BDZ9_9NEIS|nr:hypothetical protein HMPREF9123_1955 [Neisseria bacilliformis ATCC BAA-1200]